MTAENRVGFFIFAAVMADLGLNLALVFLLCAAESQSSAQDRIQRLTIELTRVRAALGRTATSANKHLVVEVDGEGRVAVEGKQIGRLGEDDRHLRSALRALAKERAPSRIYLATHHDLKIGVYPRLYPALSDWPLELVVEAAPQGAKG